MSENREILQDHLLNIPITLNDGKSPFWPKNKLIFRGNLLVTRVKVLRNID